MQETLPFGRRGWRYKHCCLQETPFMFLIFVQRSYVHVFVVQMCICSTNVLFINISVASKYPLTTDWPFRQHIDSKWVYQVKTKHSQTVCQMSWCLHVLDWYCNVIAGNVKTGSCFISRSFVLKQTFAKVTDCWLEVILLPDSLEPANKFMNCCILCSCRLILKSLLLEGMWKCLLFNIFVCQMIATIFSSEHGNILEVLIFRIAVKTI